MVDKHEDILQLQSWLRKNGVRLKHLKPAIFSETGRGLMAMKNFYPGDLIISIPEHLLISSKVILKGTLGEVIKRYNQKLTPLQCLCAFFILEKVKGHQSFWSPYMNSLPETFDTPGYFTSMELSFLPNSLKESVEDHNKLLAKNYQVVKKFLMYARREGIPAPAEVDYGIFLWAWFVINTRTLYMEHEPNDLLKIAEKDCYIMAPFLDLLNHSPHAEVEGSFNSKTKCYEIYTKSPIHKFEQVFIHYGPHDNHTLLLEYGFVVPNNPHNVVRFGKEEILQHCKSHCDNKTTDSKKQFQSYWEEKLRLTEDKSLTDLSCSNDGLSWQLECFLGILILGADEMKRGAWRDILSGKGVSDGHEQKRKMLAVEIFEVFLKESQEALEVVTQCPEQTAHIKMAAHLRREEVDILKASLNSITELDNG